MEKSWFQKTRGFTLLELLLSVAVIGLLAVIIVVYLGQTKARAQDGGIKANLTQVRHKAAFLQNENDSYESLCQSGLLNESDPDLKAIADEVHKRNGARPIYCYASKDQFCVQTRLASGGDFCVDYEGRATSFETNCTDSNKRCSSP